MKFTIPGRLAGTNEITRAERRHWAVGGKLRKEETERCAMWALSMPVFKAPVALRIRWIEPNMKRDIDNIRGAAKFILDALVHTGKLPDDSRKWVKEITDEFPEPDKKNPRIEVEVTKI